MSGSKLKDKFLNFAVRLSNWRYTKEDTQKFGQELMDVFAPFPEVKPEALVVFGAGEVSGAVARRAAEFVADGGLQSGGTIYFMGGVKPHDKPFAHQLMPLLINEGISPPIYNEAEGPYMMRIFKEEFRKSCVKMPNINLKSEDKSQHAQASVEEVMKKGAAAHYCVGIMALPYYVRRAMGTWRAHEKGEKAALRPIQAWPKEIGITADHWIESPIARAMVNGEARKYLLPSPAASSYVRKGYCRMVNVAVEQIRLYRYKSSASYLIREQITGAGKKPGPSGAR